jgi:hypothetical protein
MALLSGIQKEEPKTLPVKEGNMMSSPQKG